MADDALVKAVVTFLNEGLSPGCLCKDCVESETAVAEGVIKLVRDHDADVTVAKLPLPDGYVTEPTGTTTTRPMRSNL